jgi:hypothetical protein
MVHPRVPWSLSGKPGDSQDSCGTRQARAPLGMLGLLVIPGGTEYALRIFQRLPTLESFDMLSVPLGCLDLFLAA